MPFKSKAQQRYLYAREPKVAERYAAETPKGAYGKLPERAKKKKRGAFQQVLSSMRTTPSDESRMRRFG